MKKQENSPYLKKKLKTHFLSPIMKCDTFNCFCRFSLPGWCLEEFQPSVCEYYPKLKQTMTFGVRIK
jgi:hypothetical protein